MGGINIGKDQPQIFVSHAGKQYVHRLIQALLANCYNVLFCSPIWIQQLPAWTKLLPSFLRAPLENELRKRLFKFEGSISIDTRVILAIAKEIIEQIPFFGGVNRAQFFLEQAHDRVAARMVRKRKPKLVIGYEISSLKTFKAARECGAITILDLAQVHFEDTCAIAKKFPAMSYILQNPVYENINARKQAEYELTDYFITLSTLARQSLVANGIPEDRIYVASLGFDINLFTPKSQYAQHKELRLLICGTDLIRKGLGLLVQVLEGLQTTHQIHLTVVGPKSEVKKVLGESSLLTAIDITGFLSHDELVMKYQQADLFVFPSYLDSWAMTVLEAMACGTPVIVTENTGSKDAVIQGGGLVIKSGDPEALKSAIQLLYNDRDKIKVLGIRAREIALQYIWESYYQQIGEIMIRKLAL